MNKKNKRFIMLTALIIILAISFIFILQAQNDEKIENNNKETNNIGADLSSFISCLKDSGVVIYGSATCPACIQLLNEYENTEVLKPIYVECNTEPERCQAEMLVNYVPAIQINGEVFDVWGSPENLAEITNCEL